MIEVNDMVQYHSIWSDTWCLYLVTSIENDKVWFHTRTWIALKQATKVG